MGKWQSLHKKGYKRASQGEMQEAEELLKCAIVEAQKSEGPVQIADSQNCLAVVYKQLGEDLKARSLYNETIKLKPDSGELGLAFLGLAELEIEEECFEDAIALFDQAIAIFERYECGLDLYFAESKLLELVPELLSSIEERGLSEQEVEELKAASEKGYSILNFTTDSASEPKQIVEALDHYVDEVQDAVLANPDSQFEYQKNGECLAFLWGEQLIKSFGWQWIYLKLGRAEILAAASPDRSQVVYPLHFLCECFEDPELDCTILLAFNMLQEVESEDLAPKEYDNVMESVFRIVPKEGRVRSLAAARLPE